MNWKHIHSGSVVVDLHNHAILKKFLLDRDLTGSKTKFLSSLFKRAFWPFSQRTTFPMLEEGGVDILLSTCYIPEKEWLDDQGLVKLALALAPKVKKRVFDPTYFDATINMMDAIEKEVDRYNKEAWQPHLKILKFVKNTEELDRSMKHHQIAMIHSVEGGHSLQGAACEAGDDKQAIETEVLHNLERLSDRGVAYLTLAHFYPNVLAPPVFPYPNYGIKRGNWKKLMAGWDMNVGLSNLGKLVVERMCELKMIIDIAHCTPQARSDVYDIVGDQNAKVINSHAGAFEINPDPYNLHDWELKWLADHGGVLGIILMNYWISPIDTGLGLKYIEQTISHVRDIAGIDTVGLGTDFDGFTDPPDEITDISELPRLTRYLSCLSRGVGQAKYSHEDIRKILGSNALRVLMEGWR